MSVYCFVIMYVMSLYCRQKPNVVLYGSIKIYCIVLYWGNKEWLTVHYGEFEEPRGWVILNNARADYSESPTRVPLQISIMHS